MKNQAPTLPHAVWSLPPKGAELAWGGPARRSLAPTFLRSGGFTLIELLVAIGIMAVMAGLSWRGIDAMVQTQSRVQQRSDALLTLQAGLAQWASDLDALADGTQEQTLDWDSRSLRLLRRNTMAPADGMLVVAWTRRTIDGNGQWLRWQSPPVRTRQEQQAAWARAAIWAQNPGVEERKLEVRITALAQWEVFYFRNNAWTNPLSTGDAANPGVAGPTSAVLNAALAASASAAATATPRVSAVAATAVNPTSQTRPDGVRLVLTLPPGEALSGTLTRDWVRPTLAGEKS